MNEDEIRIPIYLITGFLESGKTSFINFTVQQDYFQIMEPTLLIACEEGEVEYDEEMLQLYNTKLEVIDSKEEFTLEKLRKLEEQYHPDRIILEYNPLWSVKELEETMELPEGWGIVQQIVTIDGTTAQVYMNNMRSLFSEMVKNADLVMFNRCDSTMPLANFRRSIKVNNPAAEIVFEDKNREITDIFEDSVPYDLDADVIEIDDVDYGIFYVDLGDHPERYQGKTVHFKGMVLKSRDLGADYFVPGRTAMTCCADDTAFIGYICLSKNAPKLPMGSWVDVTAKVDFRYMDAYGESGPVFQAVSITSATPPEAELVYFN
ncbi:MAG: GTP-binding protein [Lachnospiraceae bacterium]|nr:GTP-binding protein [Lachnospiraceae bacterium]